MFERVPTAKPDPIFGLSEAFQADSRPGKVNLGIGVYKDEAMYAELQQTLEQLGCVVFKPKDR